MSGIARPDGLKPADITSGSITATTGTVDIGDIQTAMQPGDPLADLDTSVTGTQLDDLKTKVDGIEAAATADQTAAEIRTAVDAATDSNVLTDALKTKLDGIESAATANSSNATLLARANHTGTQAISTVTGLQTALDGKASLTQQQIVFLSASGSDATAATGVIEFAAPEAMSLTDVEFRCDEDNPPTGSAAQMDLLLNGTTVFSTNPTIDASESSSTTAATAPVLSSDPTAISAGANLEFDLDQIGASNAGQGYYAILYYTRSN